MKSLKAFTTISMITLMAVATVGCGKGPKGDPGAPGQNGSQGSGSGGGKIVQTIDCEGDITSAPASYSFLIGTEIDYRIAITSSDDVYVTAAIKDSELQITGSKFYAHTQAGSTSARIEIRADVDNTNSTDGTWILTMNASTNDWRARYEDVTTPGGYVNVDFDSSSCIIETF